MLQHSRLDDLSEEDIVHVGASLKDLSGRWKNTKEDSGHFMEVEVTNEGDQYFIQVLAPGSPDAIDWGKVPIEVYYSGGRSDVVSGISAHYDFGFMETELMGLIKYGTLVLMTFNRFKDDSGRKNYSLREFLHRMDRL